MRPRLMDNVRTNSSPQNLPGDFQTAEQLQRFNMKRKYTIGNKLAYVVGTNTFPQISFPGLARMFLGFTLFDDSGDPRNLVTINLNNENIVTETSWVEFTKVNQFVNALGLVSGTSYKEEYYAYPRGLSGNDGFIITYTAAVSGNLYVTIRYKTELDFTVL